MSSSNDIQITNVPDSGATTLTVATTNNSTEDSKPSESVELQTTSPATITTTITTTEPNQNKSEVATIDTTDSTNNNKMLTTTTLIITPMVVNGDNGNPKQFQDQQSQDPQQQTHESHLEIQVMPVQDAKPQTTDKMDHHGDLINFKVLYVLAQLCGLTLIILMGTWVGVYMGGVSWRENPQQEFFWHPLLMTIGLIYLYGNGILIYRGFRNCRKKELKLTHAALHMGAFILTVIGLVAVFDSHNLAKPNPIPNMYTLHSWLGIAAVVLFSLQYVFGFVMFLAPGAKDTLKVAFMPLHIYFGLFGFVLAIASALMGLTEKALWAIKPYELLPPAGVMVNIMGVLYVIFGGLVVYMATESSYKRKPIPEDTQLLTGNNE